MHVLTGRSEKQRDRLRTTNNEGKITERESGTSQAMLMRCKRFTYNPKLWIRSGRVNQSTVRLCAAAECAEDARAGVEKGRASSDAETNDSDTGHPTGSSASCRLWPTLLCEHGVQVCGLMISELVERAR